MAGIEEAMEMKPEECLTYFEDFIFVAGNMSAIASAKAEESG